MTGTVFAVTSGKGGVGKTTTAVNLAAALHAEETPAVVLDADLGMPNVGAFLGVEPEATLHDVLAGSAGIDAAIAGTEAGVDAVAGASDLERFADADPDALESVIESLRGRYRYVVVDTGGGLSYEGVSPIEHADAVVLVTTPFSAAVADTETSKQLADRLGVPVAGVVVTQATEGTRPASIADELGAALLGSVAFDPRIRESAADGTPVVAGAPESQPADAYRRIASALVGGRPAETEDEAGSGDAAERGDGEADTDDAAGDASTSSEPRDEEDADTIDPDSEADRESDSDSDSKAEPDSTTDEGEAESEDGNEDGTPTGDTAEDEGETSDEEGDEPEGEDEGAVDDPESAKSASEESSSETNAADSSETAESSESDADTPSDDASNAPKRGPFGRLFGWLR